MTNLDEKSSPFAFPGFDHIDLPCALATSCETWPLCCVAWNDGAGRTGEHRVPSAPFHPRLTSACTPRDCPFSLAPFVGVTYLNSHEPRLNT